MVLISRTSAGWLRRRGKLVSIQFVQRLACLILTPTLPWNCSGTVPPNSASQKEILARLGSMTTRAVIGLRRKVRQSFRQQFRIRSENADVEAMCANTQTGHLSPWRKVRSDRRIAQHNQLPSTIVSIHGRSANSTDVTVRLA